MTVKYRDENHSMYPKSGSGCRSDIDDKYHPDRYSHGIVATPQGYVITYSHYLKYKTPLTTGIDRTTHLEIIKDGRVYYRIFDKDYTQRGIVTKAKQFAKDIFCIDDTDTNG